MVRIDGEDYILGIPKEPDSQLSFDVAAVSRCCKCDREIYFHPDLRDSETKKMCVECAGIATPVPREAPTQGRLL